MLRTSRPGVLVGVLAVTAAAALATAAGAARAAPPHAAPPPAAKAPAKAGDSAAVPGFLIQSSARVSDDSAVSKPGFNTSGWVPASARSTVLAALLANGKYADPFFST